MATGMPRSTSFRVRRDFLGSNGSTSSVRAEASCARLSRWLPTRAAAPVPSPRTQAARAVAPVLRRWKANLERERGAHRAAFDARPAHRGGQGRMKRVAIFDADSPGALAFVRSLGRAGVPLRVYSHR